MVLGSKWLIIFVLTSIMNSYSSFLSADQKSITTPWSISGGPATSSINLPETTVTVPGFPTECGTLHSNIVNLEGNWDLSGSTSEPVPDGLGAGALMQLTFIGGFPGFGILVEGVGSTFILGGESSGNDSGVYTSVGRTSSWVNPLVQNTVTVGGELAPLNLPDPNITVQVQGSASGTLTTTYDFTREQTPCPLDDDDDEMAEVSISNVRITQAVFDSDIENDGQIDLVKGRSTAILVDIEYSDLDSQQEVEVEARLSDGTSLASEIVNLSGTGTKTEFPLIFIPTQDGDQSIIVEVDPNDAIMELDETNNEVDPPIDIAVHETKKLNIQYAFARPAVCDFDPTTIVDCSTTVNNIRVLDTISNSNKFIQDVYPIPDNGIINVSLPFQYTSSGNFLNRGIANDLSGLRQLNKKRNLNAKRIVGLVPDNYFEYHGKKLGTKGVTLAIYRNVVLASLDRPDAVAHELGHTFGFGEGYKTDSSGNFIVVGEKVYGYSPLKRTPISGLDIMGASIPGQTYWISATHWNTLVSKLNVSGRDPELLVMDMLIRKNGTVTQLPWLVVDGLTDFVEPGDYAIILKDISGQEILNIPFDVEFKTFEEPFGEQDVDETLIGFSIPYPTATALVEIMAPNGIVLDRIDPVIKTFSDLIEVVLLCWTGLRQS